MRHTATYWSLNLSLSLSLTLTPSLSLTERPSQLCPSPLMGSTWSQERWGNFLLFLFSSFHFCLHRVNNNRSGVSWTLALIHHVSKERWWCCLQGFYPPSYRVMCPVSQVSLRCSYCMCLSTPSYLNPPHHPLPPLPSQPIKADERLLIHCVSGWARSSCHDGRDKVQTTR